MRFYNSVFYGFTIGNFLLWIYIFSQFLIGKNVLLYEHSLWIAAGELITAIILLGITFYKLNQEIKK